MPATRTALGAAFALALSASLPASPGGDPPLTESEALGIGLSRPEIAAEAGEGVGVAEAERIRAGRRENPSFAYQREQVDGSPQAQEDYYTLSQTFDHPGRRRRRAEAAAARLEGATAEARSHRATRAAAIREAFFSVLAADRRLAAHDAWLDRFDGLATAIARRVRAGDASAYDRQRLETERLKVASRREAVRAERDHAREELASLLGEPGGDPGTRRRLAGSLLPEPLPDSPADLLARLADRPDLVAHQKRIEAARIDRALAQGTTWRGFNLNAGAKIVDTPGGNGEGFIASLVIPLPISDRGRADRVEAEARWQAAQARATLAREGAEGQVRGLFHQARGLERSARSARDGAQVSSAELLPLARSTYEAGESGILELLDAERAVHEAELDAIDLEAATRRVRIALDLTLGEPR